MVIEVFDEERGHGSDWEAGFLMDQGTAIGSIYKVHGDHTSITEKLVTRMKEIQEQSSKCYSLKNFKDGEENT